MMILTGHASTLRCLSLIHGLVTSLTILRCITSFIARRGLRVSWLMATTLVVAHRWHGGLLRLIIPALIATITALVMLAVALGLVCVLRTVTRSLVLIF